MLQHVRYFMNKLDEEIKYHESIQAHKSSLEASLWGLEEQIRMPENSAAKDQEEINIQINQCREKILSCKKLIKSHELKVQDLLSNYKLPSDESK